MRLKLPLVAAVMLTPMMAAAQTPQLGIVRPAPYPVPEQHLPSTGAPALTQDQVAPILGAALNAGPNNSTPFSGVPNPYGAWDRAAPQDTGGGTLGGENLVPNTGK